MLKLPIIILLMGTAMFSLSAQVFTVKDIATNQGIENALIYSKNQSVVTDKSGKAKTDGFKSYDTIQIQHPGYFPILTSYADLELMHFKILMEENLVRIDEIVVSANRWEQDKGEVPNQIKTIKANEIAFRNVQTSADLLGLSKTAYIQKSQLGGGSPMIRGFSANRLLIVVDGVRMNNAIFRSGNLQNIISIDALAVENAEVLMGPGSVIYGSDALGGVMDFHTLKPDFSLEKREWAVNAFTRYSSANNEKTAHLDLKFSTKKWAFLGSASFSDFGDLKMGSIGHVEYTRNEYVARIEGVDSVLNNPDRNVQKPTAYNQISLMQKIRFKPSKSIDFQYGFYYSELSDVPRYDRLIEYKSDKLAFAEWYYGPQKWMMNSLTTDINKSNKFFDRLKLVLAHQSFVESRNDRKLGKNLLNKKEEQLSAFSFNADFDKKLNETNDLFYGFEYLTNHLESKGYKYDVVSQELTEDASRYPDQSIHSAIAIYLNHKYKAGQKFVFNWGMRMNHLKINAPFDTTFYKFPFTEAVVNNSALNGSAGVVYKPSELWQFKLNLSTGFRSPNIDDIGKIFDSEPGNVVVPNPGLEPEYAYNLDFTLMRNLNNRVQIEASYFYTILRNAIVRRDFLFNGLDSIAYEGELSKVQALVNTSRAYVFGFYLELRAKIFSNLYIHSNLNYTIGEEQDENTGEYVPLRHAPPLFGSTHLIYKNKRIVADLYAEYNSGISTENLAPSEKAKPAIYAADKDGMPYCPGWQTFNLKFGYAFSKHIQINAGIENILDVRYRPYSSGIVAPGRNFILSIKAGF